MNSPRMRTLPISADPTTAPLPAMASASTVPGAKTPGFSQLLQQWDTATRTPVDAESSREGILSYGSATDAAAGEHEAALPGNAAGAASHAPSVPSTSSNGLSPAALGGIRDSPDIANVSSISAGTPGAKIMQPGAVVSSSETNQLAGNVDNTGAQDSVTHPNPGGAKKSAAKPAEANPHPSGQRTARQSSTPCPVHSAPAASAAPIPTVVPLPTKNQAVPEPGDHPASGTAAQVPAITFTIQNTAPHSSSGTAMEESFSQAAHPAAIPLAAGSTSSAAQPQNRTLTNAAPAAAGTANPEVPRDATRNTASEEVSDVVRDVARQVALHDAEALTKAAANSPASPSLASLFTSAGEPSALQPRAKPQTAMASTYAAPNTQPASSPVLRATPNSAQPTANAAPLPAGKMPAKSDFSPNQSVPVSGDGALSHVTKSTPRDDNASRAGNSSAPRQTNSGTDASASTTPMRPRHL